MANNKQIAKHSGNNKVMIEEDMHTAHGGVVVQGAPGGGAAVEIMQTRTAQEVQAAMTVAQRFPRDENQCIEKILRACQRTTLAQVASYAFPRGNETVAGPSIRLAEAMAQHWKHLNFGFIEVEQRRGQSTLEAYAWDMETNVRRSIMFTVPHVRHTKRGSYPLTDPRDIYEVCANQAQRRVRSCILALIPGDVIDQALETCVETLKRAAKADGTREQRIEKMVTTFAENFKVTREHLEKRLGHRLEATTENELVTLGRIYNSLRDNMADPADFFEGFKREDEAAADGGGGGVAPASRTEDVKRRLLALDGDALAASAKDLDEINSLLDALGTKNPDERSRAIYSALGGEIDSPAATKQRVSSLSAEQAKVVIEHLSAGLAKKREGKREEKA